MTHATTSTTVVQAISMPLVRREAPLTETSLTLIIMKFGAIFVKHGTEKDILSRDLREAGKIVVQYAVKNLHKPFDEFLKGAIERIELVSRVLCNGRSRFVDPWLVEGVATWEKAVLDIHIQDSERFSEDLISAVPHNFAKEVLDWLNRLPIEINDPLILLQGLEPNHDKKLPQDVRDYQRFLLARELLEKTRQNQKDLDHIEMLEKLKSALEKVVPAQIDEIKKNCEREEQTQKEQAKRVDEKVSKLESQQKETFNMYQQSSTEAQNIIDDVNSKLAQARAEMSRQQAEIAGLWNQLISCSNRINDLEGSSSCTIQ